MSLCLVKTKYLVEPNNPFRDRLGSDSTNIEPALTSTTDAVHPHSFTFSYNSKCFEPSDKDGVLRFFLNTCDISATTRQSHVQAAHSESQQITPKIFLTTGSTLKTSVHHLMYITDCLKTLEQTQGAPQVVQFVVHNKIMPNCTSQDPIHPP